MLDLACGKATILLTILVFELTLEVCLHISFYCSSLKHYVPLTLFFQYI